ncbi:DivIVA domain-containing protein [Symbioplanes lichenis]|uniref:DivIVA domain-containing protein n=1 Tax=Symbioplanes lichenis TaxID=1629072 RepID=UPI0027383952|nr:DivIVA domain-containing protein [Actinoplanes lichenis]
MSLTPADVHNIAFKRPPMGKRGYDEEEVDAFLDEVEQELIRLLEENNALQDQVQRSPGTASPASTMVINSEFADLAAQLDRLREARARAEDRARSMQAQLEEARSSVQSAPARPAGDDERTSPVLMMAQRTADEHMRDAQRESDAILGEARTKAEEITGDALLKADNVESEARRNHSEAINSLQAKRAAALDEIDRLGQLAQGYQGALKEHLGQQLEELNSVANKP